MINEGTTKGRSLADEFGGSRRLVGLVAALVILGLFLMGLVDGQVDAKAEIERGLERASKAIEGTKKRVEPEGSLGVVNERGYTMSPAAESWGGGFTPGEQPDASPQVSQHTPADAAVADSSSAQPRRDTGVFRFDASDRYLCDQRSRTLEASRAVEALRWGCAAFMTSLDAKHCSERCMDAANVLDKTQCAWKVVANNDAQVLESFTALQARVAQVCFHRALHPREEEVTVG